jgi:hypothetical protein
MCSPPGPNDLRIRSGVVQSMTTIARWNQQNLRAGAPMDRRRHPLMRT